ncbi:MAG: type III-B CRISPR-associated protein Cas10/Cmr2 [Defluviicoccus sp.]|nr:type III-B CRISPR-associated protein Cas10/Cmr2 [Defluviicoccus sp.]MDG4608956.1 type III-B CRISPR-associated protein Cas10/Cmr2 [Defluviicoccus sp.]
MTDNKHIFHFSLGPVQGFIGTARRTRDLWAGSFLLSWLSAVAMAEVRKKGGKIVFPSADADPLVARLEKRSKEEPRIGTVPNRFKAEIPQNFDPASCRTAVNDAWKKLAAAVWDTFPAKVASEGNNTKSVWDRQIENFWEISWVKGERGGNDGAWLDNRKTWRSHRPHDENKGGDHCTLMGDWQEISGYVRARERADQENFWSNFRECEFKDSRDDKKGKKLLLDIVEGERLCAIALIKRLFPRLTKETREEVFGWDPCREGGGNWPSTGHIASAHWIEKATTLALEKCQEYANHVHDNCAARHFAEQDSQIRCVKSVAPSNGGHKHWFGSLDANFYFRNDLMNERAMPIWSRDEDKPIDSKARDAFVLWQYDVLLKELRDANKKVKAPDPVFGEPMGYFALLRMDGDRTGELREEGKEEYVAQALTDFTVKVKSIVPSPEHNGVLVYAGGDDVLALFPIEDALEAALALRNAYLEAFQPYLARLQPKDPVTISAGLVFADHHEPFRHVVEESRRLLEDIAKDKNGRDSIACSVLKPSGKAVEWVATWTLSDCSFLTEKIGEIAAQMRDERPFSTRFIYNLRTRYLDPIGDRFEELNLTPNELEAILAAERSGSRELPKGAGGKEERRQEERELVRKISQISRPHRKDDARASEDTTGEPLQTDALMLARFLAQKGLKVGGEKT